MRKLSFCGKKLVSLALVLAVLLGTAVPALGAETVSDAASSIRLSKTEGTVSVTNSSGRSLSVRTDMRLYNGYRTETEGQSYAWINLDSSKLIKLDEVSQAEVRKSGRKLEVLLNSGNLYFDVSQPLEEEESLSIRTSTMIVGVRGTCGWVKVRDAWHTQVYLLEGRVECSVTDPATGESRTTVLQGGETAEFVVYPQGQTGERCDIIRESYTEQSIDGFVLVELVKDRELCEKIYDDSKLDVLGHFDRNSAQKRLETDQAAMGEQLKQLEKAQSAQDNHVSQDPVWTGGGNSGSDSSGGSSTGGGGSGSTPEPSVVTLNMPRADMDMAIQQALDRPATRQVVVAPGAAGGPDTLEIGISMTVPAGKTLTLNSGVPARVQGSLTVEGTVDAGDDLTNDGNVTVNSANTLRVRGRLVNNRTMTVTATGRCVAETTFTNSAGAVLSLTGGARVLAKQGFTLTSPVSGWSVSDVQSDGYYHLQEDEPPQGVTMGEFTIIGGEPGVDYEVESVVSGSKTLKILTDTPLTVKNENPAAPVADRIVVEKDVSANITLDGVNIAIDDQEELAAFEIAENSTGNVTVTLAPGSTNSLKGGMLHAGLEKSSSEGTAVGTLVITGSGALDAQGGYEGAGIGGHPYAQNIVIKGGTITAGSSAGTDIGPCDNFGTGKGADITVEGGTVIGSVSAGKGQVRISSGTVEGQISASGDAGGLVAISGGTVNGSVSANSVTVSNGAVHGTVGAGPGAFTMTGGEVTVNEDVLEAVRIDGDAALTLTGGTITNQGAGPALGIRDVTNFPAGFTTVIRGAERTADPLPDGFADVRHDDGYCYLEPGAAAGAFTVGGGTAGTDYDYAGGVLTVKTGAALTVRNTDPDISTDDRIVIAAGAAADLTLAGVNIDTNGVNESPIGFEDGNVENVTITLTRENTLIASSGGYAALDTGFDSGVPAALGTVTLQGAGSLTAIGGSFNNGGDVSPGGAAIGGSYGDTSRNITVLSGTYDLTSGGRDPVPALGGPNNRVGIRGGVITARQAESSYDAVSGNSVTVSGGEVRGSVYASNAFTITGGEIIHDGGAASSNNVPTVTVGPGSVLTLTGGTLTSTGGGCALELQSTPSNPTGFPADFTTVIRGAQKTMDPLPPDFVEVSLDGLYLYLMPGGTAGDLTVAGGTEGVDYDYDGGTLTVKTDTALTIQNADLNPDSVSNTPIKIAAGVNANVTLAGVNIDMSATGSGADPGDAAFEIAENSSGKVTVTLEGENTLKGGLGRAGLEKNGESAAGTLTIKGGGSLTAAAGQFITVGESGQQGSAGIGGGAGKGSGNITIESGTVTAQGSDYWIAGIGTPSAYDASAGPVAILSGAVTGDIIASSFTMESGTLNGSVREVRDYFTMTGGDIICTSGNAIYAIGLADLTLSGGTITHSGTYVFRTDSRGLNIIGDIETVIRSKSNEFVEGLGSGSEPIYFNPDGYTVTETPDSEGYYHLIPLVSDFAVTGGEKGIDYLVLSDKTLYIRTDTPMTISMRKGVDKTTTDSIYVETGVNAKLTLNGVNIDYSAEDGKGTDGRSPFEIAEDSDGNVTITLAPGSSNVLKACNGGAALQKLGNGDYVGQLTIQGSGALEAVGGTTMDLGSTWVNGVIGGSGIGSCDAYGSGCANILITGDVRLTAVGGAFSYGIGGANGDKAKNIVIESGTVDATISATSLTIRGGQVSGGVVIQSDSVSVGDGDYDTVPGTFRMEGGTLTASADRVDETTVSGSSAVEVNSSAKLFLAGGTITYDGGYEESAAIYWYDDNAEIDVELTDCDVRAKSKDTVALVNGAGLPENFAVTETPDSEGYYHLTPLVSDFAVTGGERGVDYLVRSDKALSIRTSTPMIISMREGVDKTTTDSIYVESGVNADLTLNGVNIDLSATGGSGQSDNFGLAALEIAKGSAGDVTVTLAPGTTNTLHSGAGRAGLEKLGIDAAGSLTIQGGGTLIAEGGAHYMGAGFDADVYAAGIGGWTEGCSNVTIAGGTVYANGSGGAGIGCDTSFDMSAGIRITGGTVNLSGYCGISGSDITISGGTVNGNVFVGTGPERSGVFRMEGGTLTCANGNTITVMDDGKLSLTGGTITCDGDPVHYSAIFYWKSTVTADIELTEDCDVRGKTADTVVRINGAELPNDFGYKAAQGEDGYWHLAPKTSTTLSSLNLTAASIAAALENSDMVHIENYYSGSGSTDRVELTESLTIPVGKVLSMDDNIYLYVGSQSDSAPASTLTVNGTLKTGLDVNVYGTLNVGEQGVVEVQQNLQIGNMSGGGGALTNAGTILMRAAGRNFQVNSGATLENRGTIDLNNPASAAIFGQTENSGTIQNVGSLKLYNELTMTGGEITADSTGAALSLSYGSSLVLTGGTVTQENENGCVVELAVDDAALPGTIGTDLRGKGTALLKKGGADVTAEKGYQAATSYDGYYHLEKK